MAGYYLFLQLGCAFGLLAVTAFFGFIPLWLLEFLRKKGKDQSESGWLSYLSCFSGGVFMATCFLDVIPHVSENYQKMIEDYGVEYPVPLFQVFICCGFFFVYFIEEITGLIFGAGEHGHSHGHGHSHAGPIHVDNKEEKVTNLVVEEAAPWVVSDEKSNFLKSLTFAAAMSFHSLLEGFALGVQDSQTAIITLFLSLLLHKSIESFSVGLQISRSNSNKKKTVIFTILVYAFMTPLGSVLGSVLQNVGGPSFTKQFVIVLLESAAAGTFIYVTFLEILAAEKNNRFNSLKQLAAILFGFILILMLQILFGHEAHGHAHGDPASSDHGPSINPIPSVSSFLVSSPAI
ncbi:Protein CBG17638 [Caenorhabditis briggsae]|uniref:Protein CBG17638 n=1 Tax=Caenorhabditis briggsae TaxID=6238 RepID=A8XRM8_CAEBR|nr:Protein CBG17638 [Caenorhabditis briggsae]CAP35302.1 Protein CBG17638 [Caenorhabditis briggsae]